jgi:hypothetical protein
VDTLQVLLAFSSKRLRSRTPGPLPFSPMNSTSVKQRPRLVTKHEGSCK